MEQHELSIRQHQHGRLIPYASIHVLYPPHGMDSREIMSWNSIDGLIPRRIPIAKGVLQLGPLGKGSDGVLIWYHNPQVPGLRWHWDPGESIEGMTGRRIVWGSSDRRIHSGSFSLEAWDNKLVCMGSYKCFVMDRSGFLEDKQSLGQEDL